MRGAINLAITLSTEAHKIYVLGYCFLGKFPALLLGNSPKTNKKTAF